VSFLGKIQFQGFPANFSWKRECHFSGKTGTGNPGKETLLPTINLHLCIGPRRPEERPREKGDKDPSGLNLYTSLWQYSDLSQSHLDVQATALLPVLIDAYCNTSIPTYQAAATRNFRQNKHLGDT
jgi:hypothetical protein